MQLKDLIKSLQSYKSRSDFTDFQVKGIASDSGKVSPDFIFIAIKGNKEDGHKFIKEAIGNGARAIIVQSDCPKIEAANNIYFFEVVDTRKATAELANAFYGSPSDKIKAVGITGTNGKTTISYLIEAILKEARLEPGVIGTVNYRFKDKVFTAKNTTPGPVEIQSLLASMLKAGVKYVVMEVSSHALDQARCEGINFSCAIFTNLTQDHLDYHGGLENYFQAKSKLFKLLTKYSFAVINNDDCYARRLLKLTKAQTLTYGIDNPADIMAEEIKLGVSQTEFKLKTGKLTVPFKTRLVGRHNIYNILAAVSWALKEGLDLSLIKSAIEKFYLVPGRLERIDFTGDFSVFVDYAHTEDALANVLCFLRQIAKARIIIVFGCGGERDKTKRPKMGKVATELADYAIITNDNPRSEDPADIVNCIKNGISKDNYRVIFERREAIKEALSMAKALDIVLVAGKGHEDYQILKDRTVSFDDRQVIRECLNSAKY